MNSAEYIQNDFSKKFSNKEQIKQLNSLLDNLTQLLNRDIFNESQARQIETLVIGKLNQLYLFLVLYGDPEELHTLALLQEISGINEIISILGDNYALDIIEKIKSSVFDMGFIAYNNK